ncbi:MAG: hypothetical protein J5983_02540 [Ruminococcus sp.]|nr:hypothetical protein [Ruminococcus sp.]
MATKKDTIAIETTKDTTKAIETRAGILKEEPVAEKKTAAKKTTAKKTELKTEFCLQFGEKEYTDKEILKMVKAVWTKEMKRKVGEMKKLQVYMKPEESAAYFVINGEVTGKVEL